MAKFVCSICGKEYEEQAVHNYNGQIYCNECFDENFIQCEKCGKIKPKDDLKTVVTADGNEQWCSDCRTIDAFYCQWCYTFYSNELDHSYVRNYGEICGECLDRDFRYCDCCERYVYYDDYNSDRERCYDCCEDDNSPWIDDYHTSEKYKQGEMKKQWKGLWRGLGFELEIDRTRENRREEDRLASSLIENYGKHLALEYDGSLENGFEIISAPHTIEEFYKFDWDKVLQMCKESGYVSHDMGTCGLHIHISRNMLGATYSKQNTALAKIIYFYENNWQDILALSRRTQSQAEQWASRYCVRTIREAKEKAKSNESRYYAINNTNEDTIEFRLCRGTLKKESFYAWIDFTLKIAKNSRKIKWADIDNLSLWLKGITKETAEYMREKNAFEGVEKICA